MLVMVVMAGPAAAQEQNPLAGSQLPFVDKIKIDRAGGVHLTKWFAVVFGGIKQGSSIALGPAVSHDFEDGSFLQVKGVYSIRHFKLLQTRYDSRPLFSGRGLVSTRLRWQDAPELPLYAIGPDSSKAHIEYREQKSEWSGFFRYGLAPHLSTTVGSGLERYELGGGVLDLDDERRLGVVPDQPGLTTRPWFVHSFASIGYDSRLSPDFSRTGTALLAGTHHYHDMEDGRGSFRGYEAGAVHLVPTFRTGNGPADWKGALSLSGRAWLTDAGEDSTVPFFLMPTLGGDFFRGYKSYRFRDRNAVLLIAEYSYAVHRMVDVAGFYEAGSVADTARRLGGDMPQDVGGGIRVHTKTTGLMRLDLAHGRDGMHFSIGFNIAGG